MPSDKRFWVLGHKVTYIETSGDYSLLEVSAMPGIPGPPPHFHEDAAELFHVISGQLDILVRGRWRTLTPGKSLLIPAGGVHTFHNNTTGETRFITTWSPRGFEGFFLEFGVPVGTVNAFEKSLADEMQQRALTGGTKYGMVIVS